MNIIVTIRIYAEFVAEGDGPKDTVAKNWRPRPIHTSLFSGFKHHSVDSTKYCSRHKHTPKLTLSAIMVEMYTLGEGGGGVRGERDIMRKVPAMLIPSHLVTSSVIACVVCIIREYSECHVWPYVCTYICTYACTIRSPIILTNRSPI